jgi:hypothetical protein
MKSRALPSFWQMFEKLPAEIQQRTHRAYRLWRVNPSAKGLYFKRVSASEPIYSVRIGLEYRALGLLDHDTIYWYFIGNHDDYERAI